MRRFPVVIIAAAVIGSVGLSACGGAGTTSSTAASAPAAGGSQAAVATVAGSSPASAPASTPATSAAATHAATHTAVPVTSNTPPHSTASAPPVSTPPTGSSGGTVSFTVPAISGDNIVSASGSYEKIGTARVKVSICAKQTGSAFSVGAVAYAYNSSGADKNVGAVDLTGKGDDECVSITFLFYTAHLKVHAFIGGSGGTIVKTGPTLTLY